MPPTWPRPSADTSHSRSDNEKDPFRAITSLIGQLIHCHLVINQSEFEIERELLILFFSEIEDLPPLTQEQLFNELLDKDAQKELESDDAIINWMSLELMTRLGSRLHALWNRSAGDCLLDSVLQATWGVFDRDNTLR